MLPSFTNFFIENLPTPAMLVTAAPLYTLWAALCLAVAAHLKRRHRMATGYTRKTFHFLVFFTAAALHAFLGLRHVCLFSVVASAIVFLAVALGPGHALYEALAREKDAPHRTYYVVLPWFATMVGGIFSNVFFGPHALVGYLVTGAGDAVGEPVGTRFGRHTYRVPSMRPVNPVRSLEGSFAVFVVAAAMFVLGLVVGPGLALGANAVWGVPAAALAIALLEAVSPHGIDNATLMLGASWLSWILLS